jgi:transcriptional regulator with XRE-family HTH domain
VIDEILALRQSGLSQQEAAERVGTDRTFISRLETLGEIRKGGSIALAGVPVVNKDDILKVAEDKGVDFTFLLSPAERWSFLQGKSGFELFGEAADLLERLSAHESVVILGHNRPAQILSVLLARRSIVVHLAQVEGTDGHFDPVALAEILERFRA